MIVLRDDLNKGRFIVFFHIFCYIYNVDTVSEIFFENLHHCEFALRLT